MKALHKLKERLRSLADHTLFRVLFLGALSLLVIAASFYISVCVTKQPSDAGRGGAIVVALSFYFLLHPEKVDSSVPQHGISHIEKLLQKEANLLISLMSVLGTLAWGFLDIFAKRLIQGHW